MNIRLGITNKPDSPMNLRENKTTASWAVVLCRKQCLFLFDGLDV